MDKLQYDVLIVSNLTEIVNQPTWLGFRNMAGYGKVPTDGFGASESATNKHAVKHLESFIWPYQQGIIDGFTFVMLDSNYIVIDLDDHVINGVLSERAAKMVKWFDSYTELSQSGEGLHILIKCEVKPVKTKIQYKKLDVEILCDWCVLTGNVIANSNKIATISDEKLNKAIGWFKQLNETKTVKPVSQKLPIALQQNDDMVLARFLAKCPYSSLFYGKGDLDNDDSHSADRMDYSLAKNFNYWTNNNVEQTIRLMWRSELVRDRWERQPDYLEKTVRRALPK